MDKANELYWLLCKFSCKNTRVINSTDPARARASPLVWESHEHATAFKADPFYPTIIQEREALTTAPVYEVHVRSSWNPLRAIQAAVTEVDFYKTTDEEVDPEAKPAAETQEMIRHAIDFIDSLQSPGFIAISWGIALEDRKRGVTLAGWRSVEVCFFLPDLFVPLVDQFFKIRFLPGFLF